MNHGECTCDHGLGCDDRRQRCEDQHGDGGPVYVLLASDAGSYISGARVAVTGGRHPVGLGGQARPGRCSCQEPTVRVEEHTGYRAVRAHGAA